MKNLAIAAACAALATAACTGLASGGTIVTLGSSGDFATISGTSIRCARVTPAGLTCVLWRNNNPVPNSYGFNFRDGQLTVARFNTPGGTVAWASPKLPKLNNRPFAGPSVSRVTVKVGDRFRVGGTHVLCDVETYSELGKVVVCALVERGGIPIGSPGVVLGSHVIMVKSAAGSKSKVLFKKTF